MKTPLKALEDEARKNPKKVYLRMCVSLWLMSMLSFAFFAFCCIYGKLLPDWLGWFGVACLPLGLGLWFTVRALAQDYVNGTREVLNEATFDAGLCPSCGYNLKMTPGHCPECGATRQSQQVIVNN